MHSSLDWRFVEYGGFWRRWIAAVIDFLLYAVLITPVAAMIFGLSLFDYGIISAPLGILAYTLLPGMLVIAFWLGAQATPGKMLMGLMIVDARTGEAPDFINFLLRYLGYYISGFFLCLGYIWAGFDPRKRAWHDMIAGTVVVKKDSYWRAQAA